MVELMSKVLFIGFKGKNNTSGRMAESISPDHLLLTNSFTGLKKDIDSITEEYDLAVLFGVDKTLSSTVRLEKSAAMDGKKLYSKLELSKFAESLEIAGIDPVISDDPGKSLCNEAYWHTLRRFNGRAVFIHIPTIRYADEVFIDKMIVSVRKSITECICRQIKETSC